MTHNEAIKILGEHLPPKTHISLSTTLETKNYGEQQKITTSVFYMYPDGRHNASHNIVNLADWIKLWLINEIAKQSPPDAPQPELKEFAGT